MTLTMRTWEVHIRRLPMRPGRDGYYSSGQWLPRLTLAAVDAATAGRLGHDIGGIAVPGVTKTLVDVVTPDTEPVHTVQWWLHGSPIGALPARRITATDGRTTAWVMEDGREWLRVTRSPDTNRWSAPTSDVVEVPAHMRRRRWDSPNTPRFELEDLYRVVLDVTNGAFHD